MTVLVAACGDGESGETTDSQTSSSAQAATPVALTMPAVEAGKKAGVLAGTIAGDTLSLNGTCSMGPDIFEFWSDGKQFAVNSDSNGDKIYLNIMIRKAGSRTMAALNYARDGEIVYKGVFDPASYDGSVLSVDSALGREARISANFKVSCNG